MASLKLPQDLLGDLQQRGAQSKQNLQGILQQLQKARTDEKLAEQQGRLEQRAQNLEGIVSQLNRMRQLEVDQSEGRKGRASARKNVQTQSAAQVESARIAKGSPEQQAATLDATTARAEASRAIAGLRGAQEEAVRTAAPKVPERDPVLVAAEKVLQQSNVAINQLNRDLSTKVDRHGNAKFLTADDVARIKDQLVDHKQTKFRALREIAFLRGKDADVTLGEQLHSEISAATDKQSAGDMFDLIMELGNDGTIKPETATRLLLLLETQEKIIANNMQPIRSEQNFFNVGGK